MRCWPCFQWALIALFAALAPLSAYPQTSVPDFYVFEEGQVAGTPGTVVAVEKVANPIESGRGYRFLYRTTGLNKTATIASGLFFVPNSAGEETLDMIVWAHPTTGIAPQCAPSIREDVAPRAPEETAFAGIGGLELALRNGFVVVAPDYVGLGAMKAGEKGVLHPFLNVEVAASSIIDAVKAARKLPASIGEGDAEAGNVTVSDRFAIYGHSQGSHAALAVTVALLSSADPAPTLRGVAVSGAANRLGSLLPMQRAPDGMIVTAYILAAFSRAYSELDPADFVSAEFLKVAPMIVPACVDDVVARIKTEGSPFPTDGSHLTALPEDWMVRLRANTPTDEVNPVPGSSVDLRGIYVAQGGADPLVPVVETALGLLGPICDLFDNQGLVLDYVPLGDHTGAQAATEDRAIHYVMGELKRDRAPLPAPENDPAKPRDFVLPGLDCKLLE